MFEVVIRNGWNFKKFDKILQFTRRFTLTPLHLIQEKVTFDELGALFRALTFSIGAVGMNRTLRRNDANIEERLLGVSSQRIKLDDDAAGALKVHG